MLTWDKIDTVLIDMDGTLLDLHYDNYFWMELVPNKYAEKHQITHSQAQQKITQEYHKVADTLVWYCFDFWTEHLGLDIKQLQHEAAHKIAWREDSRWFLDKLGALGKQRILLTNAHRDSLMLKVEHTQLDKKLDQMISTHDYGLPKEKQALWQGVQDDLGFNPARTLFLDDSEKILKAAQTFGIGYLVGINKPDSAKPVLHFEQFPHIKRFSELF